MPELPASTTPTATQINVGLLLIRIASALAFLYHGIAILFGGSVPTIWPFRHCRADQPCRPHHR